MLRSLALALLVTSALVPAAVVAQELPTGGQVQAGSATIATSAPGALAITQHTDRAVIDWQSFSVGEGGRVDISQPGATSALLNRVTGDATSVIAGQVNANGRVFLVNPNGVLITRTGSVSAAAFTASTLDIADRDFMAGSDELTVTAPRLASPIRYLPGGFAGALAEDKGAKFVLARETVLSGTGEHALDLGGDGFLQVAVRPGTIEVAGRVTADQIVLTTASARAAARGIVNVSGVLDASSVSAHGGTITLTGDVVNLTGATLDASGAAGGGRIRVGLSSGAGPARGEGSPTLAAERLTVDATTRIAADATGKGDGGDIVLWSDARTGFAGGITARGADGGVGGNAEVSGKAMLDFTGTADLTGARFGTLLLDPYDVAISTLAQTTGAGFAANGNNSIINVTTLQNALATANVTVSTGSGGTQNGDIYVAAPISWASGSLLTLSAAGRLIVNSPITINGGGQLALNFTTTNASDYTQGLTFAPGSSVSFADGQTGQALAINGTSYTLLRSMADVDGIDGIAASTNPISTIAGGDAGFYALAKNLDASGTTYSGPLFGYNQSFSGVFEGLGHVIANLSINRQTVAGGYDGRGAALIEGIGTTAVVRDLGLTNVQIVLASEGSGTGALANYNYGTVNQAYSSGSVVANGDPNTRPNVGGLVAVNVGKLYLSYSAANVSGAQPQYIGGLVGNLSTSATIARSYATGTVTADAGIIGGLVGYLAGGSSTAATTIVDSYATGAVTNTGSTAVQIGGLVGSLNNFSYVANSYATGSVTSASNAGGGLIGFFRTNTANNAARNPVISNLYWDTQTSGLGNGIGAVGTSGPLPNNYSGTGLTTAQLQNGTLPAGFDPGTWVAVQGFYPQLVPAYSAGFGAAAMQIVSGTAYQSVGGAVATGAAIGLYNNGSLLSGNKVTTDASGNYKALVPAQTLSGTFALGQTIVLSGASAVTGLTYNDTLTTNAAGNVTGLTIASGISTFKTGTTSYSALNIAGASTFGSIYGGLVTTLNAKPVEIAATLNSSPFTVDQAVMAGSSIKLTAAAGVAVNAAVTAAGTVRVYAGDAISIGQNGSVTSQASGDAIILAATNGFNYYYGTFSNAGGANALSTPNGRWLVYQESGTGGDRGGLAGASLYGDSFNTATGSFATAPSGGSRFVYLSQPLLNIVANAGTVTYNGAVQGTDYGYTGLINGDTLAQSTSGPVGINTYAKNVGSYTLSPQGIVSPNGYLINYQSSTFTITPATLTYGATAVVRAYGDANPALTGTITGFLGSDTKANSTTGTLAFTTAATTMSGVGSYAINGSGLNATNYVFTQAPGNATALTISARPITIAADAKSRTYGDANPALTYTIGGSGLVNGDQLTGAIVTGATVTSGVGAYAITQGTLAATTNYALTYQGANLSVTARPIIITADAQTRMYGDANPALTYVIGGSGLVNGDTLSGVLATMAGMTTNVGSYAITQGTLAASANYALTYQGANLAVTVRPITVSADALTRVYGDANPALTYVVGGRGLVNGDTLSGALATTAGVTSNVGQYAITQGTLAATANYALTYQGANLAVTVRPITIAADAKSRLYGDANPALTYTIGGRGLVNGDTLSGALATTAGVTSNVGQYAITQGTLAATANYALTYQGANLAVTVRPITIAADAKSRIYGDVNPALTYVVGGSGLTNGDMLTGALATTATATTNVGQYAITQGSLAASTNYMVTFQGANLTVGTRAITVTADAKSRVYGDANPALTYTIGNMGLANGDTLTGALATAATMASNAGAYAITQGSLAASANYALTYQGASLAVTARPITIAADAQSRVYGDANPALTYVIGGRGLTNGDTLSGALTTTAGMTSNVGQYAITQGTLAATANYALTYQGANLAVTVRPITIAADAKSRIYGDANPALTYVIGGRGLVNGDMLTGALATDAMMASNVGQYIIAQGTLAATANYALTYQNAGLTITPATLTYTATPVSRIYGNANPALTGSVSGFKNQDSQATSTTGTAAFITPATVTSGVGSYAVQGGGLAATNYVFVQAAGNATALAVTVRPITVAADALTRVYGDANPALTYTIGGNGLANGDVLAGALATGATATSNVGQYAIAQGTLAASANYALTYQGANLTVTTRTITVAANALTRLYGDANPALTYTIGGRGLANGDTLSGALTTAATAMSNVGQYAIGQGMLMASANYALAYQGATLSVTPATLTYVANTATRLYGNANPALTGSVTGFRNVDTQATSTTGTLAFTTPATTMSGVGTYAILGGGLAATNYVFTQAAGNATALTVTVRPITVSADAQSRVYGDANPALTYAVGGGNGLVNGDQFTGTLATGATTASGIGQYAIAQGDLAASANYALTYQGANLTVTARPLTIAADAASRVYGDANPALTYTIGGRGLANGDMLTGALTTGATAASNIGQYAINQGTLAASGNYAVSYQGANLTVTVRPIIVAADALTRVYGDANPALTYSIGGRGLVNGDMLTGGLATAATQTSGVGQYGIDRGTLAAGGNYALTFQGATLTVTPATLVYAADTLTRTYGDANPTLTGTVTGFRNQDTAASSTSGSLVFTTAASTGSPIGRYAVAGAGLTAANYVFVQSDANANALTIAVRPITIAAGALSRTYGDANPVLTYTIGGRGLANGDTLAGSLATGATGTSSVGQYAIGQGTLAASANYVVTYQGANLSVSARPITAIADALTRVYGDANPALTYTVGGRGLVNGDMLAGALATSATPSSGAGQYAIGQGTLMANGNYVVTYQGANLGVLARPLTITANPQTRLVDEANPTLTYVIGGRGLVNGDALTGAQATSATDASGPGSYAIAQGSLAATANYVVTYTGSTLSITAKPTRINLPSDDGAIAGSVVRDHAFYLPTTDAGTPVAPPVLRFCPSKGACVPARP